jgi:uncharacterized protein
MNSEILRLLEDLKANVPGLRLVIVFGSHASGRAREDSDIDMAFAAERPLEAGALFDLKMHAQCKVSSPVDLIDLANSNLSVLLKHEIITTGQPIFERDQTVLSEFEARILRDYHDFMYRRRDIDGALVERLGRYANA